MKKLCPISMNQKADCIGPVCAWWCKYANDCAVPVIAGVLADSTICQNIWWTEPPKEET